MTIFSLLPIQLCNEDIYYLHFIDEESGLKIVQRLAKVKQLLYLSQSLVSTATVSSSTAPVFPSLHLENLNYALSVRAKCTRF